MAPRASALASRTVPIDTGKRQIEHPVDALGRVRWRSPLDQRAVERRAAGDPIGFKGHAAVFNKRTWIGPKRWGWWEQVAPSAFTKTIGEADVRFLQNHDPNLLLARNKAGTLRLSIDDVGLVNDADMAPVSYAQDLAVLLERGDINQMSFAFEIVSYDVSEAEDGNELITLTEVRLWDTSVVTYPAYVDTDASLRALGFGELCRSAGLDETEILRRLDAGEPFDLGALGALGTRGPAETTPEPPGPPAETTGFTPQRHLRERLLAQRAKELSL